MSNEETFNSVDDILTHYKKQEQETFKRTADIIKRFGWGGEIKLVEVKKDAESESENQTAIKSHGARNVPDTGEDRKGQRHTEQQLAESVPEKLRKGS